GQGRLLPLVAGLEGLGAGLDPAEAADVLYAIASPETYRLLVEDRAWTPERYEAWSADAIERLLFRG
ncbi:MAG: TetR/AcrR family transcriptional regulator, partial [Candidatus Limnocylindria bacterium]